MFFEAWSDMKISEYFARVINFNTESHQFPTWITTAWKIPSVLKQWAWRGKDATLL